MDLAALVVSIFAIAFTAVGLLYTRRATQVSVAAEARAREPRITLIAEDDSDQDARQVFYKLRNDGPQDLNSVALFRPRPSDGLTYPIALVGGAWAEDDVDLGKLDLAQEVRFTLACGTASPWPDFRVKLMARAGRDAWTLALPLPEPRRGSNVY